MKLVDNDIELKAIRSMGSSKKLADLFMGQVTLAHFKWEPTRQAFHRFSKMVISRHIYMTWSEICSDPGIDEKAREIFKQYKSPPVKTRDQVNSIFRTLEHYRLYRILHSAGLKIANGVRSDKSDPYTLLAEINKILEKAETLDETDPFRHMGVDENSQDLIEQLLEEDGSSYIRTGFKAFDIKNVGIPRSSLFTLCGPTGGGKTTIAIQLSKNMALEGAKVCLVSLEMNQPQVMIRKASNISEIPMSKLLNPKDPKYGITEDERKKIPEAYKKHNEALRAVNGKETVMVPTKPLTITELLFKLKPMKYDVIIIDYLGLMKGMDGENQWLMLGNGAKFAKTYATQNNCIVIICAQFDEQSGNIRYSRAVREHSSNMWVWNWGVKEKQSGVIEINQQKSRNNEGSRFQLRMDFSIMTVRDATDAEKNSYMSAGQQESNNGKKFENKNGNGFGKKQEPSKYKQNAIVSHNISGYNDDDDEPAPVNSKSKALEAYENTKRKVSYKPAIVDEDGVIKEDSSEDSVEFGDSGSAVPERTKKKPKIKRLNGKV